MHTDLENRHGETPSAGTRQRDNPAAITRLKNNFIEKPSRYYSMSIAEKFIFINLLTVMKKNNKISINENDPCGRF
jgi:hypothetical protein